MISSLFNTILYKPLLNLLVFLYEKVTFEDLGIAIILITILVRIVLLPLFEKQARYQLVMQKIQPKIKEVEKKHKGDREKQTAAMLEIYKEHKTNPFSGFLILFIQIPILFALYKIISAVLGSGFVGDLYSFIPKPENINVMFLGLINLGKANILIVVLAALAQFFQAKTVMFKRQPGSEETPQEKAGRTMVYVTPLLTVFLFYNFPAAISLYWLVASVLSVIQQIIIKKKIGND